MRAKRKSADESQKAESKRHNHNHLSLSLKCSLPFVCALCGAHLDQVGKYLYLACGATCLWVLINGRDFMPPILCGPQCIDGVVILGQKLVMVLGVSIWREGEVK